MRTTFDGDDWENQLDKMLGPDGTSVAKTFHKIIEEWEENVDEPYATIEISVSEEDVSNWLEACHQYCLENGDSTPMYGPAWWLGVALCHTYLTTDMEQTEPLSAAVGFFLNEDTWDEDDLDDEEEDDDWG